MTEFYGMKTGKTDRNGSSLYEFDRVHLRDANTNGTILNVADPYHPVFRLLLDKKSWKNPAIPEYISLDENLNMYRIKDNEYNFIVGKTEEDYMNFCKTYDYRGNYVKNLKF